MRRAGRDQIDVRNCAMQNPIPREIERKLRRVAQLYNLVKSLQRAGEAKDQGDENERNSVSKDPGLASRHLPC